MKKALLVWFCIAALVSVGYSCSSDSLDDFADVRSLGDSGSPTEIWDWYDFDAIRNNLSGSYVLMTDLNSTTAGYDQLAGSTANEGKGWEPIGSMVEQPIALGPGQAVDPFAGTFDGQQHEVEDLFISCPDEDGVGLFGSVAEGGVIENFGVVNAEVTGRSYVGGLVGCAFWGSTVSDSCATVKVTGNQFVGGLIGGSWGGNVNDSYSIASVTGDWWVGGLMGGNWGTVSNSYSTGNVVGGTQHTGGLMGGNWGTVSDCHSNAVVSGGYPLGGLVGWNHHGTVSNSYFTGNVTGWASVGGLVGENHDGTVRNSYYDYDRVLISGEKVITTGALYSEDFGQWLADGKILDVNERLCKEGGYYLINDVSDLKELLAFSQNASLKFKLTNDLDLSGESGFYIPYLAGQFDGNGHRIANLSLTSSFRSQVGLFGYLASGGVVTGVGAENVDITGQGAVGGLVGENDGTVSNSYATGKVAGYWSVGGLVGRIGWNRGTVSNSHYNYDEFLISGKNMITIGALFDADFKQWLANDRFLDINGRLAQEDSYYLINNIGDFKQLLVFGQNDTLKFRLANDIDLGYELNFYIPYLAGEFDGNGHKVQNLSLYFDFGAQVGLFGNLAPSGKVTGVGAENVNITVACGWQIGIGGLVGSSFGAVSYCYSTGSVGYVMDVGGLVGWNAGTVSNSYSRASVSGHGPGGLVGWNYGGTVQNSYSTGRVTAYYPGNGLVASNTDGGTVSNSFWDTETSGQATSGGGTGKTTAEMKSITTFKDAGWDIRMTTLGDPTGGYPFLSWQLSGSPIWLIYEEIPAGCVATASDTGTACFSMSNGTIEDLQAVPAPTPLPHGVRLPHGMFTFKITGLTPGQSVTLTVEFPDPIPTHWVWWKYHDNTWSRIPISRTTDPRIITFTLTDGVYPGDEDTIPGQITDQGGPGNPGTVGWETYPISKARVMLPWVVLFAAIIAGTSLLMLRRRHS